MKAMTFTSLIYINQENIAFRGKEYVEGKFLKLLNYEKIKFLN